ncbi:MAG: tetratricopeptide repeat protein [Limisphaerales bacterium]
MEARDALPKKLWRNLWKQYGLALSNAKHYPAAIRSFEQRRGAYRFTDSQEYKLAMLYDHLAMRQRKLPRRREENLKRADSIYRHILRRNPGYFLARYGVGRVQAIRGNYRRALRWQITAYRQMLALPRGQRGALAIGVLYHKMGNDRNAERWYLKEYRDCRRDDFGTTLNLFTHYKSVGEYTSAARYLSKLERLLKAEYRKPLYRGLGMMGSSFVKTINDAMEAVRAWTVEHPRANFRREAVPKRPQASSSS